MSGTNFASRNQLLQQGPATMNDDRETIALLLEDSADQRWRPSDFGTGAQLLVRDAAGHVKLEAIQSEEEFDRMARTTGCFRRGKPILDPMTRDVIGYEMEEVPFLSGGATD